MQFPSSPNFKPHHFQQDVESRVKLIQALHRAGLVITVATPAETAGPTIPLWQLVHNNLQDQFRLRSLSFSRESEAPAPPDANIPLTFERLPWRMLTQARREERFVLKMADELVALNFTVANLEATKKYHLIVNPINERHLFFLGRPYSPLTPGKGLT